MRYVVESMVDLGKRLVPEASRLANSLCSMLDARCCCSMLDATGMHCRWTSPRRRWSLRTSTTTTTSTPISFSRTWTARSNRSASRRSCSTTTRRTSPRRTRASTISFGSRLCMPFRSTWAARDRSRGIRRTSRQECSSRASPIRSSSPRIRRHSSLGRMVMRRRWQSRRPTAHRPRRRSGSPCRSRRPATPTGIGCRALRRRRAEGKLRTAIA
mmetsp:Transcript_18967/g.71784  ORF Transcript_18967/g.71784 Transcript_18967/m.71784 type:complete len:214 (-) Transcript_18967:925-1566(-)